MWILENKNENGKVKSETEKKAKQIIEKKCHLQYNSIYLEQTFLFKNMMW